MNPEQTPLLSAQERMEIAQKVIFAVAEKLSSRRNIKGIVGFGSFFDPTLTRQPHDIDIAIYCDNDVEFRADERDILVKELAKQLPFPVETHVLTDFTPSVGHELSNFRKMLVTTTPIWGKMPTWL